jgi:hypothetical protein
MPGAFEGLAKTIAAVVPDVPTYQPPVWADPQVWLVTGAVLVMITAVGIYLKFRGEEK